MADKITLEKFKQDMIERASKDAEFRKNLMSSPKATICNPALLASSVMVRIAVASYARIEASRSFTRTVAVRMPLSASATAERFTRIDGDVVLAVAVG